MYLLWILYSTLRINQSGIIVIKLYFESIIINNIDFENYLRIGGMPLPKTKMDQFADAYIHYANTVVTVFQTQGFLKCINMSYCLYTYSQNGH